MDKKNYVTILIILGVIILSIIILNKPNSNVPEDVAKCIGQNSKLYIQLGCHACGIQEEMFGENYKYLDVIDCFYEKNTCIEKDILKTPTWIIKEEKYVGVQSIEKLKELTGC